MRPRSLLAGIIAFAFASLVLFDWFQAGQRDLDLQRAAEQLAHDTRKTNGHVSVNAPDLYKSEALSNSDGVAVIERNGDVALSLGKKLPVPAATKVSTSASYGLMTVDDGAKRYRIAHNVIDIIDDGPV
jgi:hypothetical protein